MVFSSIHFFIIFAVAFGDAHWSMCAERESGVNPEQCPLLYAFVFRCILSHFNREGASVRRVRKPAG